jgi:hypothetical protein
MLNEMYGVTLGLGQKPAIGVVGAQLGEEIPEETIDEKKDEEEEVEEKAEDKEDDKEDKKPPFFKKKEDKEEGGDKEDKKPPFFKKKDKKAAAKGDEKKEDKKDGKKCPFMTKEDQEWWSSVQSQVSSDPNHRNWDGISKFEEEALLPPKDDNADVTDEPKPGEFGFAPVGKIAWTQDLTTNDEE